MNLFSKPFDEFSEKSLAELRTYVYHYLDDIDGFDNLMDHRKVGKIILSDTPEKLSFEDLIERECVIFKHKISCTHYSIEYYPYNRDPWLHHFKFNDGFLEIVIEPCGFKAEHVLERYRSDLKNIKSVIADLNEKIEEYNNAQLKIFEEEKAKYDSGFYNARKLIDDLNGKLNLENNICQK